jgi:hypothetical protein
MRNSFRATNNDEFDSKFEFSSTEGTSSDANSGKQSPPLKGYIIPNEDVRDYIRFTTNRDPICARQYKSVLPYEREQRLCVNRGISELKQGVELCKIDYTVREYYFCVSPFKSVAILSFIISLLMLVDYYVTFPQEKKYQLTTLSYKSPAFFQWYRFMYFILMPVIKWLLRKIPKSGTHCYCPHWVSSALTECDLLQPMEVAVTNVEHAVRRIACLPIPDSAHIHISHSSALVALFAIRHRNFQAGPVPCVAELDWTPT